MSPVNALTAVAGLAGARAVVRDLTSETRYRFEALTWFYGLDAVPFPLRSSDTLPRLASLGNTDNPVHPWLVTSAAADLLRAEGFGEWLDDVLSGGGFRVVYSSELVLFRARVPWQSVTVTGSAPVHLAKLVRGANGYGVNLQLPLDPSRGWAGSEFMTINGADRYGAEAFDLIAVSLDAPPVDVPGLSRNSSAAVSAFLAGSGSLAEWRKLSRLERSTVLRSLASPVDNLEEDNKEDPAPVASLLSEVAEVPAPVCPPADLVTPVAPVVPPLPSRAPVVPPLPSCAPSVVVPPLTHPGLPFRRSRKNKKRLSLPPLTAAAWVARAPSAGYTVENLGSDVYNLARRDVSLQVHLSGAVVFSGILAAVYGGAPRRWLHAPVESDWLGRYLFDF